MAEAQPAHRVHSSAELGGSEPSKGRQIVVAVDRSEPSQKALKWALDELYRSNDTVHVVYVAKVLSPEQVVLHGPVGSSYKFRDNTIEEARTDINNARAWLATEVEPQVKRVGAVYVPHLFVDQNNAPADVVAHTIAKVVAEVDAKYTVLAKSSKTAMEKFFVGSVASATSRLITSGSITLVS
ncbi:hypothetical protein WJX81_003837 [Elliptochloris bilobata]|uniref:UspA domain-containing protein n=1 Tax=Elliptochloris bilobata TaxID=381761 RepID=A0AAW1SEU0_9CHLO